jgi:hypothetical protein
LHCVWLQGVPPATETDQLFLLIQDRIQQSVAIAVMWGLWLGCNHG